MPKYAFGIAARDEAIARADANQRAKQENIYNLFNGLGMLAQSVGIAHRAQQNRANEGVMADYATQMMGSPEGAPGAPPQSSYEMPGYSSPQETTGAEPSGPMPSGAPPAPTPWGQVLGDRMRQDRQQTPGGFFEGLGQVFNPTGRLAPRDAISLMQMQAQQATAARGAAKDYAEIDADRARAAGERGREARSAGSEEANAAKTEAEIELARARARAADRGPASTAGGDITSLPYATLSTKRLQFEKNYNDYLSASEQLEAAIAARATEEGDHVGDAEYTIRSQTMPFPIGQSATPASLRAQANKYRRDLGDYEREIERRSRSPGTSGPPETRIHSSGNAPIDMNRPIINNPDGSFSTERTITIGADGKFLNIPTIVGGQQLSNEQAIQAWRSGQNQAVGTFASQEEAVSAAQARSAEIGQRRGGEAAGNIESKYLGAGEGAQEVLDAFKQAHNITGPMSAEDEPAFIAWVNAHRAR